MTTQAIQKQPAVPKSIKSLLNGDYFKQQVALCLPKHLTADRFVRVALTSVTRIPKLANCTWESVLKCMMTCSELGIEPDGRRAHLIPFGTECTLIIDYKGLVELAMRSGLYSGVHADIICRNDTFVYDRGQVIEHKVDLTKPRGDMYGAYVIVKLKEPGLEPKCEVMPKEEIDRIRKRSKASNNGPWVTDYNEMAKKTVFRRASKWLALSPEVQDALEKDADNAAPINLVVDVPEEEPAIEVQSETAPAETQAAAEPEKAQGDDGDLAPQPKRGPGRPPKDAAVPTPKAPQDDLAGIVNSNGYSFDDFKKWLLTEYWDEQTANNAGVDSWTGFAEVGQQLAKQLLRAPDSLLKELEKVKGGAK